MVLAIAFFPEITSQFLLLSFNHLIWMNASWLQMTTRRRIMQKLIRSEDLKIDYILLAKIKRVRIANRKHGSKPNPAIFNRPVLRCQKPCNWDEENNRLLSSGRKQNQIKPKRKIDWSNRSTVSTFANALIAVQQLSYGSIKIRHSLSGSIDDVAIANEIARCCTSNEIQGGCYNFLWTWEDDAKPPKKSCGECKRGSTSLSLNTKGRHQLRNTGTRCCEDKNIELSTPYGLGSVASGNRSIAVEAESSTNSNEKFSLLRLCCSSDSTDSSISEIEISSQVEVWIIRNHEFEIPWAMIWDGNERMETENFYLLKTFFSIDRTYSIYSQKLLSYYYTGGVASRSRLSI